MNLIEGIDVGQLSRAGHGCIEQFCEVVTTVSTEEEGARLQEALVCAGLTTGVNLAPQSSVFIWDDAWGETDGLLQEGIARIKEYQLRTIVRASDCDHVVALLERRHPDKTPLISMVPVVVNARFAAWFTAQLTTEGAATVH